MRLWLSNIAKIRSADVKIDGITIIAGKNDTGKSTVGKALFALFNSMSKIKDKIIKERKDAIRNRLKSFIIYTDNSVDKMFGIEFIRAEDTGIDNAIERILNIDAHNIDEDIKLVLENILDIDGEYLDEFDKLIIQIKRILSITENEIVETILDREFKSEFDAQINNMFSGEIGNIKLDVQNINFDISIENEKIKYNEGQELYEEPVYIDNPFIVDDINDLSFKLLWRNFLNGHKYKLVDRLMLDIERENIFEELIKESKLSNIFDKLKSISNGNLTYDNGEFVYEFMDKKLSLKNLSAGIKTFAIIKKLIHNNSISDNGTLILDEPEIHLHPEWQIIFAEIIVLLHKELNLHILLTTHSPYFLRAIEVFSKKYELEEKTNYYVTKSVDEQSVIENVNDDLEYIYEHLSEPFQYLENLL